MPTLSSTTAPATSTDVLRLMLKMKTAIEAHYPFKVYPENRFVGQPSDEEARLWAQLHDRPYHQAIWRIMPDDRFCFGFYAVSTPPARVCPDPATRIAVLCGGMSSEREVSLRSGNNCLAALHRLGYTQARLIDMTADVATQTKGCPNRTGLPGLAWHLW
ncbi:MAG: hypothetical protein R2857_15985 [Vampirovibrionales bacterium]